MRDTISDWAKSRQVVEAAIDASKQNESWYEAESRLTPYECGAELRFGQHKSGKTLFAKRKDEQGNWLDHGGWMKFQRQPRRDE